MKQNIIKKKARREEKKRIGRLVTVANLHLKAKVIMAGWTWATGQGQSMASSHESCMDHHVSE